jgi:Chlorophyll A-B binding protein
MKFSAPLIILASLASTSVAFSPSGGNKKVFTKSGAASVSTTNARTTTTTNNKKQIFDPLGLYGKNTAERKAGLIRPLESSAETTRAEQQYVIDPLSLYRGNAKEQVSVNPDMSASVPFLPRPKMLDGSLPGDRGFDPLNLSNDESALTWYRDAEMKHSRLAMLAAVGWPIAELYHKAIATNFDLPSILNVQDKVPSVLNGGLDATNPLFWVAAISAAAAIEFIGTKQLDKGAEPGDFGFDPLGLLKNKSEEDKFFWKEAEIFNGRLAQLAILSYVLIEAVSGTGIVNQTPSLFGL